LADLATSHWDNIDFARNEIRIRTRKSGKRLSIPIAPPLKTHIKSRPTDRQGYLHPKAAATVTSQKRSGPLSNQFANLLAQAGLRDKAPHRSKGKGRNAKRSSNGLSIHALRHTAVSLLKDAGIPEAVVMELVGHESKAMSAHYTHVGNEALAKAVAALPEI
jgi:integrase